MSFLQIGALWALPLVLIPIVIHLIHGRRHPTTQWAAMMFLQRAMDARRGPTRLRRWLILSIRIVVLAGLIFALARPLSSGLFGVAAGRLADSSTAILIVDRSPSMQVRLPDGKTRLEASVQSVSRTLATLGVSDVVLLESVGEKPVSVKDPRTLADSALLSASDSTSSVADLFVRAVEYLSENDRRVADIWVCSDRQSIDWRPDTPRWDAVSSGLAKLDGKVRIYETVFPEESTPNVSVVVTAQRAVRAEQGKMLDISVRLASTVSSEQKIPVRVTLGDVTDSFSVLVNQGVGEGRFRLPTQGQRVPATVSITADANTADDTFFFIANPTNEGRVGLLLNQPSIALEVAAEVLGGYTVAPDAFEPLDCLISLGTITDEGLIAKTKRFLEAGGSVIFFPGEDSAVQKVVSGVGWDAWKGAPSTKARFDEIEFAVDRYAAIQGEVVKLASTDDGKVLIGRRRVGLGNAYFCGCDVMRTDSVFVRDGVVLYGLLADVLSAGGPAADLEGQVGEIAGRVRSTRLTTSVRPIKPESRTVSEFGYHAGIYEVGQGSGEGDLWMAINRPDNESTSRTLDEPELRQLIKGVRWIDYPIRSESSVSGNAVVRELWGVVWILVVVAMLAESWLSIPGKMRGIAE